MLSEKRSELVRLWSRNQAPRGRTWTDVSHPTGSRLSSTSHSEAPPPPPPEEDAANAGGRRARKSVNYALPKLNS